MYSISDEYKKVLKSDEQQYDVYIILQDGTKVDEDISGFKPVYNLGEKIIGNFITKRVEFTLFNTSKYNITNQEFEVYVGLKVNNEFNYISLGKFIANKPEIKDEAQDECSITAQNYSLKFKIPYEPILTFPCTVKNAIKTICNHLSITYIENDFINSDYILEEFFIDEDATFFDVIKVLVESGFANADITNTNSLIVKSPQKTIDYTFSINELFELKKEDNKFGPVNAVVASRIVADDGSTTEDVFARNETSITKNGLYEYKIKQNDAIDYDRQTAVNNILAGILDFEYVPATIETVYNPASEVGDMYEVPDKKTDTSFLLFAKEITADLSTGLMTIESTEETKTETDYKSATNKDKRKKTEAKVNKLEGKITLLTQETNEHEEKISSIEMNLDSITTRVSDTESGIKDVEQAIDTEDRFIRQTEVQIESVDNILDDVQIYGDLQQESEPAPDTPAKIKVVGDNINLLNNILESQTINGITLTVNSDKTITINGTASKNFTVKLGEINLINGETYTLSGTKNGSASSYRIDMRTFENGDIYRYWIDCPNDTANNRPTVTMNETITLYPHLRIQSGTIVNNVTIYPKIEKGTVATGYTSYGIGSIDYKNFAGNLFDINNDIELDGQYRAYRDGSINSNSSYYGIKTEVLPSTTYISGSSDNSKNSNLCFFDKDMNYLSGFAYTGTEKEFTTPNNCKYVTIAVYKNNINSFKIQKNMPVTIELPQNEFLAKIGNVEDYIDNKGVLHKYIKKITLKGTETFYYNSNYNYFVYGLTDIKNDNSNVLIKSTHFIGCKKIETTGSEAKIYTDNGSNLYFINTGYTTVDDFKSWLSEQYANGTPVEIFYVLDEPYNVEITAENRKKYLNLPTLEGENNISISASTSATYKRNTEMNKVYAKQNYVDEKFAEQVITNDSITSRVSATETTISNQSNDISSLNESIGSVNNDINNLQGNVETVKTQYTELKETVESFNFDVVTEIQQKLEDGTVTSNQVKTTSVTIDQDGIKVAKSGSEMQSLFDNEGLYVNKGAVDKTETKNNILTVDKDGVITENLYVRTYLTAGYHRTEGFIENEEKRTGVFYQGGVDE